MSKTGRFITIEGTEGVGKSTVIAAIESELRQSGQTVVCTREPGGTPLAEAIRKLVLADHGEPVLPITELLLMFAGRAQHIEQVIKPALAAGSWVVSDRFTDASFAYQGGGRGVDSGILQSLASWVQGDCSPDMTFLLDAPVDVGLARLEARGQKDRIEKEGIAFFEAIRNAYLDRAKKEPARFCVINAVASEQKVLDDVLVALHKRAEGWA